MNFLKKLTLMSIGVLGLSSALIASSTPAEKPQPKKCEWGSPCWFEAWDSLFSRPYHTGLESYRSVSQMREDEKAYVISVDLPGVSKKDIDLQVSGNRIVVSAERKDETQTKEKNERSYSRYQQSFMLPDDADLEKISASSANGVLTVTVPKSAQKASRKIEVR